MVTKKKTPSKATSPIDTLVQEMMQADDLSQEGVLPEKFSEIDSIEFVKALARYKANSLGTPDYKNSLKTYAWADANLANLLLDKYEEAFPKLTGEEMLNAIEALEINLDYTVLGSHPLIPKIMPNGAVLIRNHHRIIALNDSPELSLNLSTTQLHEELKKILKKSKLDGSDESRFNFLVLHRILTGEAVATQTLPDHFSNVGQTLIFIGKDLDLNASKILSSSGIEEIQSKSRIGMAVIRSFHDRALVYSTNRHDDDFDTVIEEYAEASFDELDDEQVLSISMGYKNLGTKLAERTIERIEGCDLKRPSGLFGFYFDHILSNPDNFNSYSSKKRKQISSLRPIFAKLPNRPVHYYLDKDPYWDLSEEFDHHFAAITIPTNLFSSIEQFQQQFEQTVVNGYLKHANFPTHQALLFTEEAKWASRDDLAKFNSEKAKAWVTERAQDLQKAWQEESDNYEDESDFLRYTSIVIDIGLIFSARPDHVALNACMKQASQACELGGSLSVPHIGFNQGYDCGDYDTGNVQDLFTPEQSEE